MMFGKRLGSWVKAFLLVSAVGSAAQFVGSQDAEARAGRGRSSGRSSGYSRQTPPPQSQQNQFNSPNAGPMANSGMNQNRGGFARNLAGGIAGGFLGSMLFSSLGNAAGGVPGVGGTGGKGGIGMLEILLFAGLAYFGFRWWKRRQQSAQAFQGATTGSYGSFGVTPKTEPLNLGQFKALSLSGIEADEASDIFFKVQAAWTRRDLASVDRLLDDGMRNTLTQDLEELKRNRSINRLENITVRRTDVGASWQEGGKDFTSVRFTANLLDYTVEEASGRVLEGSDSEPVKFEEEWTFSRSTGGEPWQLAGIQQS